MAELFQITPDREFLKHFLTRWRTLSISPEMVQKLKENKDTDPYAAYGYGRWLSLANPEPDSLKEAEVLLIWAATKGNIPDAKAALGLMYYDGRVEADKAMPEYQAVLSNDAYKAGSELQQYLTLLNTVYGNYGYKKDPDLVVDILQKHLEKNPLSDPIYYDLLAQALESSDKKAAEKTYLTSIERGNTESYFSLANLYQNEGDLDRAFEIASDGARKGAVNCRRFKAGLDQEDYLKLSPREQDAVHREIVEGLEYAIDHYDRYACYLKGALLCDGLLGFPEDPAAALAPLERGCAMGVANCYWLKAYINYNYADSLPSELKLSYEDFAKTCLQAARLGDREPFTLEQIARAYVSGYLKEHTEEIEKRWLKEYLEVNPEEEDSKDSTGVVAVYPQGFYYCMDADPKELDLDEIAEFTGARSFDIVHFSPLLTRITKALSLDKESCHVAMLVDKDGFAKDIPDNMCGTLIYGQGSEILGTVVFVLEDDKSYDLMPMLGLQRVYMFLQLLDAATQGLVRMPTAAELKSIGAEVEEDDEEEDVEDDEPGPWSRLIIDVDYSPSDPGINNHFCESTPYGRDDVTDGRRLSYEDPGGLFGAIYVKEAGDDFVTLFYRDEEYTLTQDAPVKKLDTGGRNYTNFYLHARLEF